MRRVLRSVVALAAVLGCTPQSTSESVPTPSARPSDKDAVWAASDKLKESLVGEISPEERESFSRRTTRVERVPAPFFPHAELYRATSTNRAPDIIHHPTFWNLGRVSGQGIRMIRSEADWQWLRSSGVSFPDDAARIAYIQAYTELFTSRGRAPATRYGFFATSVNGLALIKSDPRTPAFTAKYADIVKPPSVAPGGPPWRVVLFATTNKQELLRVDATLDEKGDVKLTDTVLEADAPVPLVF